MFQLVLRSIVYCLCLPAGCLAGSIVLPFSLWAQTSSPLPLRLTLQDCLELASQNNLKLEAKDYAIEGAKWRLEEAQAGFWPIFEFNNRMAPAPKDAQNAAQSFFEGDLTFLNTTKFGVGLPLYTFGQLDKAQGLAKEGIKATRQERAKDENKIRFEVKQLYYSILLAHNLGDIAQDAIHKISNQLKKEEETHQHSPYQVLKLKIFRSDLERRSDEALSKEKIARQALRIQLGFGSDQAFELADTYLEPPNQHLGSLEKYLDQFQETRPDSHLVEIGVNAKRLEFELEKKKLFPRVGLGGFVEVGRTTGIINNLRFQDDYNNPFNFTRAGMGLEFKGQLDFHGSHAKIKRLKSEYHKVALEGALAKNGMALEVEEAYREALRLRENVARADEKRKMARQMVFLSKSNIDVGVGEEQEYTDALQLVLLTRSEYLKAVFDYNVALAKLEEKVGGHYGN